MIKPICSKCNCELEPTRTGKQRYCKKCHADNMKQSRPNYSGLTDEQRLKSNARAYLRVYIKRGKIVKHPCSVCGDKNSQAHHEDYSKPLEVSWYCRKHHLEHHHATSRGTLKI